MKRRFSINLKDFAILKTTIALGTLWFVGLLAYWISPIALISFIAKWRWAFLALALIIGTKTSWKMFFGARSAEGLPSTKKKITKKKVKKK
jgi:hypothetical protein